MNKPETSGNGIGQGRGKVPEREGRGRVTLADIARRAGVSRVAVSYALREGTGTSAGTRERIRAIAKELGYRPDPGLTRLMARLHEDRRARGQDRRGGGGVAARRAVGVTDVTRPYVVPRVT
ncbi:MAG: LacI family DNA-binding transcriptional regulator [Opitutaceae bacterium]|nr:LacI family DNA-binding transcriptional regulator [Opitutaceae bacterium]